ncbi:alpha-1,2-fucosyltransferase [Filimonas effusa]|uniref:Alpha-1,2-fucosyltransferase n=1 Tax=Filimonas effusa TaxID=2508721 RepID=A0A4Q1D3T7_9BACT|nr:alpha-1,2-fucosyltransferase [Filimonas effusa]RXK81843.1 alpha-1,2-fucosyltransferase [Filimonas effusa]
MQVIDFMGGLGNQMFQYAFYKRLLANDINTFGSLLYYKYIDPHNGFELDKVFDVKLCFYKDYKLYRFLPDTFKVAQIVCALKGHKIVKEKKTNFYSFHSRYLKQPPSQSVLRFIGYWQSPFYFQDIVKSIKADFVFDENRVSTHNKQFLEEQRGRITVAIHVRRGDYLNKENHALLGSICSVSYYQKAINYFTSHFSDVSLVFFSNDIRWCQANFSTQNSYFIDWNKGADSWQDMYIMSNCTHNIIANSSFSWWGAWLNNNEEKIVICPDRWTNEGGHSNCDLLLDAWIKIKG